MIVSCGESLIDFVPTGDGAYRPVTGGSPLNVAVAGARLGAEIGFLGRISSDLFGGQIRRTLSQDGVDERFLLQTDQPTALAFVDLSGEEPEYAFYFDGSAGATLLPEELPVDLGTATCLHFGSVSLLMQPGASTLTGLMKHQGMQRMISLDPNVRPTVEPDRNRYRVQVENWVRSADLVKVSAADLDWLYPGSNPVSIASNWRAYGPALIIITRGGNGSIALGEFGEVEVEGVPVKVADTVGAGDTFQGALLAEADRLGLLARSALERIEADHVRSLLGFAGTAAAFTCSQTGNNPPRRSDLTNKP